MTIRFRSPAAYTVGHYVSGLLATQHQPAIRLNTARITPRHSIYRCWGRLSPPPAQTVYLAYRRHASGAGDVFIDVFPSGPIFFAVPVFTAIINVPHQSLQRHALHHMFTSCTICGAQLFDNRRIDTVIGGGRSMRSHRRIDMPPAAKRGYHQSIAKGEGGAISSPQ